LSAIFAIHGRALRSLVGLPALATGTRAIRRRTRGGTVICFPFCGCGGSGGLGIGGAAGIHGGFHGFLRHILTGSFAGEVLDQTGIGTTRAVGGEQLLDDPGEQGRLGLLDRSGCDAGGEVFETPAVLTRLGSILHPGAGAPLLTRKFVTRHA